MNLKALLIVIVALAVAAAAAHWLSRPPGESIESDTRVGQVVLESEILSAAGQITISDPDDERSVVLKKNDKGNWTLPNYHSMNADFSKLQNITSKLLEAEFVRFVTRNPERSERLELGKNRITLQKKDGSVLWELETGKRGSSGGTYVRLQGESAAYLADLSVYIDSNEKSWPDKKLLPFKIDDVASVTFSFADGESLYIERDSTANPFNSEGLADDQKIKEREVTRVVNSFINARFTDVSEVEDPDVSGAREHARDLTLGLFSGASYTLSVGRRPAEILDTAAADEESVPTGESDTDEASGGDEFEDVEEEPEPGPVYVFFESRNADEELNGLMQRVALKYSDYLFNQLPESSGSFIETKETEPGPGPNQEPTAPGPNQEPTAPGPNQEPTAPGPNQEPTAPGPNQEPTVPGPNQEPTAPGPNQEPTAPGPNQEPTVPGPNQEPTAPGPEGSDD